MKTVLPQEGQANDEKTSYMTLFCALMTAKHAEATLEELMRVMREACRRRISKWL